MSKRRIVQIVSFAVIAIGSAMLPKQSSAQVQECQAGGPGSTSCSIGGAGACSVACDSDSYSCCNPNDCICKPKKQIGN